MRVIHICSAIFTLIFSVNVNAALIERLGGLAFYDDVADLTWLADANYVVASGYSATAPMTLDEANTWVGSLSVAGVTGWRLPVIAQPDASCSIQLGNYYYGDNCIGGEMGNLFYNTLSNSAGSLTNSGPFSNVYSNYYWSSTVRPDSTYQMLFNMGNGNQLSGVVTSTFLTWAVHTGDVSAVPVPAATWLFLSGILCLIGVAKHKSLKGSDTFN